MNPIANLVFIHGWGGDSRLWQPLLDKLQAQLELPVSTLDLPGFGCRAGDPWPQDSQLLDQIYAQLPQDCLLIGHSLGGMLATQLAARPGQEKIRGLITIAANATFVQRGDWPGMAPAIFDGFMRDMARDAESTWQQFSGLQARGDSAMRPLLRQLRQWRPKGFGGGFLPALECLGRWDNRALLGQLSLPALHIFGACDALVPAGAAAELMRLGANAEVLPDSGHVPQISRPELVAASILEFLRGQQEALPSGDTDGPVLDKAAVARSFGRAAASYDAAAHLQRAVCRQLLNSAGSECQPKRILDLGSGTGYGSELLRQCFPRAEIIALDLAEGMLQYARSSRPVADAYIAADAEQLPLASDSVDLVFSSMALQWCYDLSKLFAELHRVSAPGCRQLIATLGPGTLCELKDSWASVDDDVHVNRFLPQAEWLQAAAGAGLAGKVQREERVLHFDTAVQLMRELKNIGAHNVNRGASQGLMSRAKLRQLTAAYEPLRTAMGLPASYEIYYLDLKSASDGEKYGAGTGTGARGVL